MGQHKQFFYGVVTHGKAADRQCPAMYEDVATWRRAAVQRCVLQVEGVRVVDLHGQVKAAVRIQSLQLVDPFRNLPVAFPLIPLMTYVETSTHWRCLDAHTSSRFSSLNARKAKDAGG